MAETLRTPELLDQIEHWLLEGEIFAAAARKSGISKRTLQTWMKNDENLANRFYAAASLGCQMQLDHAYWKAKKASTKDKAIIADKLMSATARRAELLAPKRYGKQAGQQPLIPAGSQGMLMVKWATEAAPANTQAIDEQPTLKAIEDAA